MPYGAKQLRDEEVAKLFDGLSDESFEVRIATYEALSRLPLSSSALEALADYAQSVLPDGYGQSTSTVAEQIVVVESAPFLPLKSLREHVLELGYSAQGELRHVADSVAHHLLTNDTGEQTAVAEPIRAEWTFPGFRNLTSHELDTIENRLHAGGARRDSPEDLTALITLRFKDAAEYGLENTMELAADNATVEIVADMGGRFQPDVSGLFSAYLPIAKWIFSEYRARPGGFYTPTIYGTSGAGTFKFMQVTDLGGPRSLCYQIGWTVSRGGLHGLISALEANLHSRDSDERTAAAYFIADAADYVDSYAPPLFGGGEAPQRRRMSPIEVGVAAPPLAAPDERCVNSKIALPKTTTSVGGGRPLLLDTQYEILVNIGPYDLDGLLSEPDGQWPSQYLPGGDLRLQAVLLMEGMPAPIIASLTLPSDGASYACRCDDEHLNTCERAEWARLGITTPATPRVWKGELVIYYEVVAVHIQRLTIPVAISTEGGCRAQLQYRLSRSFSNLWLLGERSASITFGTSGPHALVNGLKFASNPIRISTSAADNAIRAARQVLCDQHLWATPKGPRRRLDSRFGKTFDEFLSDMKDLAQQGATLYNALFAGNVAFDTLPELIRHEADARNRPAILNIADGDMNDPAQVPAVPWPLVYDLPISASSGLCESIQRFGPGGNSGETVPSHCPEKHLTDDLLCPFGFWGLSCILEQPPSSAELASCVFNKLEPVAVTMAIDPGLDGGITSAHLSNLRELLSENTIVDQTISSPEELARALSGETMDIAYIYCHGGYIQMASNALPSVTLKFGSTSVDPVVVSNWRRMRNIWPRPHWPDRKPLIVLNGCHTTETTSATLSNFVDAFVNRSGAAGVIGTEVALEQGMAGWAMEMFFSQVIRGESVGSALRKVRWQMIARGNTMGLAYTPYCVAGLRMRPSSHAEVI